MKRVLISGLLFVMVLAFAASASATTLYEENFAHNFWGTSTNWDYVGGSTATAPLGFKSLNLTTNSYNKPFTSNAKFALEAGNTYTLLVDAYHTLAGKEYRDITIQLVDGAKNVIAEQLGQVSYDTMPGYGHGDQFSLVFDATQDYSNVSIVIWLGDKNVTYGFNQIALYGALTPSAVPLPGALFLFAPGLVGLAALRKRLG